MIGVVGDHRVTTRTVEALRTAGAEVDAGTAANVVDQRPDQVVAVDEAAVVDLVRAGVDAPVLPVGLGRGLPSVPVDAIESAADSLVNGNCRSSEHDLLAIGTDGDADGRAVFDVMLVRSQPGRISEYELDAATVQSRFRADGVVVATPAGSHGYAHAAGGPTLSLDVEAVAVVPVAPFGFGSTDWVVDATDEIRLTVAREADDVSILVDGREGRTLRGRTTVSITRNGSLRTVVPTIG